MNKTDSRQTFRQEENMVLKLRNYIDCDYGRVEEDHIIENPKNITIQPDREYSLELAEKIQFDALFPVAEKPCMCSLITYSVDGEFYAYACWPNSIFLMSNEGKTIDRY